MADPRASYHESLQALQDQLLVMGGAVVEATERSIEALKARDLVQARRIVEEDTLIDRKRYEIEEQVVTLLATQQPTAGDLRTILAYLHVSIELERMGDYAEGIAKIVQLMGDAPPPKPLVDIPRMSEKVCGMLRRSLDALVARDAMEARHITTEDDEIDALQDQVYRELLTYMIEDPTTITRATYLLWVTHNLERIADRTTNICERVVFLVSGRLEPLGVSLR